MVASAESRVDGGGHDGDGDDDDGVYAALEHSAPKEAIAARGASIDPAGFVEGGLTKKMAESFRGFDRAPSLKLDGFGGGGGGDESNETTVEETIDETGVNEKSAADVIPETCDRYILDFHRRGICAQTGSIQNSAFF